MKKVALLISLIIIFIMVFPSSAVVDNIDPQDLCHSYYNDVWGDIDYDLVVAASDIVALISMMKSQTYSDIDKIYADMDADGFITASDIVTLIKVMKGELKEDTTFTVYKLDHYNEFLPFIEDLSYDHIANAETAEYSYMGREKKIENHKYVELDLFSCEYTDINGNCTETFFDHRDEFTHDAFYGMWMYYWRDYSFLPHKTAFLGSLSNLGVEISGFVDYFVIEPESWVPPSVVIVTNDSCYFLEIYEGYESLYRDENTSFTLYTYEEYYEKYSNAEYLSVDVCGAELYSKYVVPNDHDSYLNMVPFNEIMSTLGAEVSYIENSEEISYKFNGVEYRLVPNAWDEFYIVLEDGTLEHFCTPSFYGWSGRSFTYRGEYVVSYSFLIQALDAFGFDTDMDKETGKITIREISD